MSQPLSALAQIHTAVVFREHAPQESPDGNVRALAIRNLVAAIPPQWEALPRVSVQSKYLAHCLQPGDVVIPARGDYYKAWLFTGATEPVLPVGQLTIIRTSFRNKLDPGFLVWYLNLPSTQSKLLQMLTGTSIKALTKTALSTLGMNPPSQKRQVYLAEVNRLTGRIAAIRHRLNELDFRELAHLGDQLHDEEDLNA